jgi:eukaryotic-like serine/threonine-protein kinase
LGILYCNWLVYLPVCACYSAYHPMSVVSSLPPALVPQTMSPDPNIGRILDNRYEIVDQVGRGAMGQVYLARHIVLGNAFAIKFLSHALLSERMRDRFYTEARTCAQLGQRSVHIVSVQDFGFDEDGRPFYVMEYLRGDSLSVCIQQHPLAIPRFLGLARQIGLGLKTAHEGILVEGRTCSIIHRDIKPSNIMICPDDIMGDLAKILDFGIAKLMEPDASQTGTFMGTPAYASPEQMDGQDLDSRSDLYSLGVMLFQMLTGMLPIYSEQQTFGGWHRAHHSQEPRRFEEANPSLKVPKGLEQLIYSCLAKDPKNRPAHVQEILEVLEPLEQRFGRGRQIGQYIQQALNTLPVVEKHGIPAPAIPPNIGVSTDDICQTQTWPVSKPVARIVFPHIIASGELRIPSLWVMLSHGEIQQLQMNQLYLKRYCNFLCTMSPHPMAMWINGIYNRLAPEGERMRWANSFLDLKSGQGQQMLHRLGEQGEFRMLFFALEDPQRCQYILPIALNPAQKGLLHQWLLTARSQHSVGQPVISRDLLKAEFEQMKPKIEESLSREVEKSY